MTEYEIDELAKAIATELRMRQIREGDPESAPVVDARPDEPADLDFDA